MICILNFLHENITWDRYGKRSGILSSGGILVLKTLFMKQPKDRKAIVPWSMVQPTCRQTPGIVAVKLAATGSHNQHISTIFLSTCKHLIIVSVVRNPTGKFYDLLLAKLHHRGCQNQYNTLGVTLPSYKVIRKCISQILNKCFA